LIATVDDPAAIRAILLAGAGTEQAFGAITRARLEARG
jgi:hypothetical protein